MKQCMINDEEHIYLKCMGDNGFYHKSSLKVYVVMNRYLK